MLPLRFFALLFVLASGLSGTAAFADTISFYNTGVDDNGNPLAAGVVDSHYSLVYSDDSNATTAMATTAHPAWVQASSTAGWISPGATPQDWNAGYYVYETTLDLTGYDPTTASLSGMIAADNEVYILLNRGGSVLYSGGGFQSLAPFLINTGFVSGVNYVDFVIHNDSGPTGLMVDDESAMASAETPEPASLLLLATGMSVGTVQVVRRARASGSPDPSGGQ